MKRTKTDKGITLIALLVTIVVLIILASVTISTLTGDEEGVITRAQTAATKYNTAEQGEKQEVKNYIQFLDKYDPTINGNSGNNGNGGSTEQVNVEPGAYVTYKGITWRVLKNDSASVELLSENAIGSATLGTSDDSGNGSQIMQAYENVETTILQACKTATGITSNIRSAATTDMNLAVDLNLLSAGNSAEYWVNYKEIRDNEGVNIDSYMVAYVKSNGDIGYEQLFGYDGSAFYSYETCTKPVRPIVTLSAGALDNVTGSGTSGQPYVLN